MQPPLRYRHTQFGTVIVVSLLLSAVLFAGLRMMTGLMPLAVIGPVLMAVSLALFYARTVEIDAIYLRFGFGVGLIRQRIPLAEVRAVEPVPNSWLYGWGIHRTPHGGLYHVSGREAVQIALASGQRFRLGTDQPRRRAQALQAARADARLAAG
ncbi:MAG TPA: hypothetical protein PLJ20_13135 [Candidatus Contendobacter sp.]|nr:hypothetical protein [Candidatus Contendobacter sp.]